MRVQGTLLFGAITVALSFGVASAPQAAFPDDGEMVQYVQTMKMQLPDGSMTSPYPIVFTVSAQRKRGDDQFGTYVVECDQQRMIYWRARDKTYVLQSFAQMAQQYSEIAAAMKANGQTETIATVRDAPDTKTAIVDGITAQHLVETVSDPNDGLGSTVSDVWYAPGAAPFECPAYDAIMPKGPQSTSSTSNKGAVTTTSMSMGTLQSPRVPAGSLVLRATTRLGPGMSFITEVTAIKTLPYDPAYFEPPADFVQVSPRPLPSFPPRLSSNGG